MPATLRKFILPVLAVCMLCFAVFHVSKAQQVKPRPEPPVTPPLAPFPEGVAGSGIIEPETENISIGSSFPGVVTQVQVKVGQRVRAGDLLFRLDDRQLKAERKYREANLGSARSQLAKQETMPRVEELPPSEAKVKEARANLTYVTDQLRRAQLVFGRGALNEEELVRLQQGARMAQEQLARIEAEDRLLKAGAWEPDKAVARAAVALAQAQVEQTRIDLDRLEVRALIDGDVLQVNVRPGEFVGAPPGQALVVLGNITRLHVRVDVDEHDIPRFRLASQGRPAPESAVAMLRGDPRQKFELRFVRVEPFVIPKKSLTGDNSERVDTRVLQVIYAVQSPQVLLYVGQQVDVYIEGPEPSVAPAGK